ncbi:hypothetical protein ABT324_08855 [Saccharopolyspora sp. NPDC000359]|uniref:hypothetical protein n=1 Tax=Saccharopolyspora sp. NPDC000359 TaxID=3154251 RepID=UPI003329BEF7
MNDFTPPSDLHADDPAVDVVRGFLGSLMSCSARQALNLPGMGLPRLREIAQLLGQAEVDWASPDLGLTIPQLRSITHPVARRAWDAAAQGRPLLLDDRDWLCWRCDPQFRTRR